MKHCDTNINLALQPQDGVIIQLYSSSDDDDMWVRPRVPAPALPPTPAAGRQRPERSSIPSAVDREQHPADGDGRHPTNSATRPIIARRQRRSVVPVKTTKRGRVTEPEAEENNDPSSGSSCVESAEDAQTLYRSAILGVRNANHSRQQARAATVNCPVCAKLAAVLEHFL